MKEIRVITHNLSELDCDSWDAFVWESENGTLFHTATFYRYHDEPKPVTFYSLFHEKQLWAQCVAYNQNGFFKSPFAASYGGICFKQGLKFEEKETLFLAFENFLKDSGVHQIQYVHAPLAYQKTTDQTIDYLLHYYGYQLNQVLYSSIIPLKEFDLSKCSYNSRRKYQKSIESSLAVNVSDFTDVERAYSLLLKNKEKFNLLPTHTLSELIRLKELFPDKIELVNVFQNETMLASVFNFIVNSTTVLAFYISTDYHYYKLNAVNRVIIDCIYRYQKLGYLYYDLGVSMETDTDNPMDPRRSLIYFKENFSSIGQQRNRYFKQLNQFNSSY